MIPLHTHEHQLRSVAQSCLNLWPMDYSPPRSSVHGILQAIVLEWIAISSTRGSSDPGIEPKSLVSPAWAGRFLTMAPPGKHSYEWLLLKTNENLKTTEAWGDAWQLGTQNEAEQKKRRTLTGRRRRLQGASSPRKCLLPQPVPRFQLPDLPATAHLGSVLEPVLTVV